MSEQLKAARSNLGLAPITFALGIAASIVIARSLGPASFADYATLMAVVLWMQIAFEVGCNAGIGRFLNDPRVKDARKTLYTNLQLRRWTVVLAMTGLIVYAGPHWARESNLEAKQWGPISFVLIAVLAGITLHSQLATSALLALFKHSQVLKLQQIVTLFRSATLIAVVWLFDNPVYLIFSLCVVATAEAIALHVMVASKIGTETKLLEPHVINLAQKHGLVSLFDKLSTALSSSSVLLIVLAGLHSRAELAVLAVATDLLQRLLGVTGLPLSNMISPLLAKSASDAMLFRKRVATLGSIGIVWFTISISLIAIMLPQGIALFYGEDYKSALPLALVWLLPVFVEAMVRMIWGIAILNMGAYRWIMANNAVFGVLTIILIVALCKHPIMLILLCLGALRLIMSISILHKAHLLGLFDSKSIPLTFLSANFISFLPAFLMQMWLGKFSPITALMSGFVYYGISMLIFFRSTAALPQSVLDTVFQLGGRYSRYVAYFVPPDKVPKSYA